MFSILILEDDPIQNENLIKIIKSIGTECNIHKAFYIEDAIEIASKEDINLFFIDVDVNGKSGIEFASNIRKVEKYRLTWMVFITTYAEHMLEVFKEIHCYDYILKPYNKEDIEAVIQLICYNRQPSVVPSIEDRKYILINLKSIKLKLFLDEIYFIEVNFRRCIVHTVNGKYEIERLTLKELIPMIGTYEIIQSHKSYLINMHYLSDIVISSDSSSSIVHFTNYGETALVSKNYKRLILSQFHARDES